MMPNKASLKTKVSRIAFELLLTDLLSKIQFPPEERRNLEVLRDLLRYEEI
jgi:hypothetical protein